jgi:hypothetical protein
MIGWLFVINDKVIGIVLITHRLDLNKKALHISVQDLYFCFCLSDTNNLRLMVFIVPYPAMKGKR